MPGGISTNISRHLHRDSASAERTRRGFHSWAGNGTSQEGFAAEWRGVNLMMVDGDLLGPRRGIR